LFFNNREITKTLSVRFSKPALNSSNNFTNSFKKYKLINLTVLYYRSYRAPRTFSLLLLEFKSNLFYNNKYNKHNNHNNNHNNNHGNNPNNNHNNKQNKPLLKYLILIFILFATYNLEYTVIITFKVTALIFIFWLFYIYCRITQARYGSFLCYIILKIWYNILGYLYDKLFSYYIDYHLPWRWIEDARERELEHWSNQAYSLFPFKRVRILFFPYIMSILLFHLKSRAVNLLGRELKDICISVSYMHTTIYVSLLLLGDSWEIPEMKTSKDRPLTYKDRKSIRRFINRKKNIFYFK